VNAIVSDEVLVCEGLACPMPVVKTKQKLEEMKPGQGPGIGGRFAKLGEAHRPSVYRTD